MKIDHLNFTILFIFNTAFVLGISLISAIICHLIPPKFYSEKNPLFKQRFWEFDGRTYEKILFIKLWKDKIPEAGEMIRINPFNKKRLRSLDKAYIQRFIVETCRAELVHLLIIAFYPFSFIFNPTLGDYIMATLCIITNLPCIIIQRYNRIRFLKLLERTRYVR